uniref:Uncharacterized protein n=1 Tax=Arundo donax TaxID=35708 RepID=A0A0A9CGB6_ARUDO
MLETSLRAFFKMICNCSRQI